MSLEKEKRIRIEITGRVQGVGFRPTVYQYAVELGLRGYVENSTNGVTIELEGRDSLIQEFIEKIEKQPPPLASIEAIQHRILEGLIHTGFEIRISKVLGESKTEIPLDTAICTDCKNEMGDPENPRYRYPFTNCTHCGPRFTIIEDLPYDRPLTTMKGFSLCPRCRKEYQNPLDRRFHAQPVSCPDCGPKVSLLYPDGKEEFTNPLAKSIALLQSGRILAIKGLGGYHLVCDATQESAVAELRKRKHRPDKPFAVMFASLDKVQNYCELTPREVTLLQSPESPIVLLAKKKENELSPSLAPDINRLGVMLPYTPLHLLLLEPFTALVMTSANLSEEPLISREDELKDILGSVVDAALVHNRPIAHKCDDSIIKPVGDVNVLIRRARGYVPSPIILDQEGPPLLATGADLKSVFALTKGNKAYLSPHLGDLENYKSLKNYEYEYSEFIKLLEIKPQGIIHDLHPDYHSTRFAAKSGIMPRMGVQHHHAHIASCIADNRISGPVIGLAFDGTGYGTDGNLWGGEFLVGDCREFQRYAHLEYTHLPGGEKAIQSPWRMAAAYLYQTYGKEFLDLGIPWLTQIPASEWDILIQLLEKGINCPLSSGMGRLFDGVYALLGNIQQMSDEGRGGMFLESIAATDTLEPYAYEINDHELPWVIQLNPMIKGIVTDLLNHTPQGIISRKFHQTILAFSQDLCLRIRDITGINDIALSGGCFQNAILAGELPPLLTQSGFKVYSHHQVPPNDGGIALGQLAIARAQMDS